MYQIISSKKSTDNLVLVYKLESCVDKSLIEKLNNGGSIIFKHFSRFDRLQNPIFTIRDREMGIEMNGRIGDKYLYCTVHDHPDLAKDLIESKLMNVA